MMKKIFCLSLCWWLANISVSWAQAADSTSVSPAISTPAPSVKSSAPVEPLNRIVAVVNDEIISESDLDAAVEALKQQITAGHIAMPATSVLRHDALEQLINYRLQMQMANRNDVKPEPEEIDQAIEQIAQSHRLTVDQLKEQLALQHTSYDEFRKKIADQLKINKLQQQMIAGQIKITDADITAFKHSAQGTQEYQLVDFFLPLSDQATTAEAEQTRNAALEIQQKLNNGADINSITPAYRELGWRTKNDLPQIFAAQLPSLTTKNASAPLHAPNGYHVLKLVETRNENSSLTDDQIRQIVFRQKYEAAVKAAVDKARAQAYVQIIPE